MITKRRLRFSTKITLYTISISQNDLSLTFCCRSYSSSYMAHNLLWTENRWTRSRQVSHWIFSPDVTQKHSDWPTSLNVCMVPHSGTSKRSFNILCAKEEGKIRLYKIVGESSNTNIVQCNTTNSIAGTTTTCKASVLFALQRVDECLHWFGLFI